MIKSWFFADNFSRLPIKRLDNEHLVFWWLSPPPPHRSVPPELIGTFSAGVQFSHVLCYKEWHSEISVIHHPAVFPDNKSVFQMYVFLSSCSHWRQNQQKEEQMGLEAEGSWWKKKAKAEGRVYIKGLKGEQRILKCKVISPAELSILQWLLCNVKWLYQVSVETGA